MGCWPSTTQRRFVRLSSTLFSSSFHLLQANQMFNLSLLSFSVLCCLTQKQEILSQVTVPVPTFTISRDALRVHSSVFILLLESTAK